jgi:hypothetical protein
MVLATLRLRADRSSQFFQQRPVEQGIYCVWHNRLALCLQVYRRFAQPISAGRGLAALVSASRDGALVSSVLQSFQVEPIRGSKSRHGMQALLELGTWAERGYDLAITPDGPRGPCYQVHEGIIALAQMTRLPIFPFSFTLSHKISVKSWDRFQIPLPFSHCDILAAAPLRVPRQAREPEREVLRRQLEASLRAITFD